MKKRLILLALLLAAAQLAAQPLQRVKPAKVGIDPRRLARVDAMIDRAVELEQIPGAVLAVVRHGKMAYLKAYGNKQVYPSVEPMDVETVFDMASCSKSISTAVSAMILVERGQLRLQDRVDKYIPGFQGWTDEQGDKTPIRVVDLLTHSSGLPAYANATMLAEKYGSPCPDGLIEYIASCPRGFAPKSAFRYSCLNFIALQRIIETVSGQSLRDFAKENIFDVLGMRHTDYMPTGETLALCAPTQKQPDGSVLKGVVHDPLARVCNGGISGNAGVFSSADDVAVLAAALLAGGEYDGRRILSPAGVRTMRTVPKSVARLGRALGWDVSSPYSSNNGDLFGPNAFGHTGYTGTSITIDPDSDTAVILLTNRAHPSDGGEVGDLRARVVNVVASSIVE